MPVMVVRDSQLGSILGWQQLAGNNFSKATSATPPPFFGSTWLAYPIEQCRGGSTQSLQQRLKVFSSISNSADVTSIAQSCFRVEGVPMFINIDARRAKRFSNLPNCHTTKQRTPRTSSNKLKIFKEKGSILLKDPLF